MSKTEKNILILLSFVATIAVSAFALLIGYVLLQQPPEKVTNLDPVPTSLPLSQAQPSPTPQPSATPQPSVVFTQPTSLPTPTNTRVVEATPTPSTTPTASASIAVVPNNAPSSAGNVETIIITKLDKKSEYVDIKNVGSHSQDITGWTLRSETGQQDCLLSGIVEPEQTLRIWARRVDVGRGGFNCGYEENIWSNSKSDPAVLFDTQMLEVHRSRYS